MSLTDKQLRSVVNMLSDSGSAANAAGILAREAKARGVLVADLMAESLTPIQASAPPPPRFSDVDDDHLGVAIGKRINFNCYGLRTEVLGETERAWLTRTPGGGETWLPKSQVEHHGEDLAGRTIFIIPSWLWRKKGLAP
jgi:hypothetical protein